MCSCFPERRSEKLAWARNLDKRNYAKVVWADSRIEFDLHILGKPLPFLEFPNLHQLLHNCRVGHVPAAILASQDLGLHVVKSDGEKDIGIVFVGIGAGNDVRPQQRGIGGVDAHPVKSHGNLWRCSRLLQSLSI